MVRDVQSFEDKPWIEAEEQVNDSAQALQRTQMDFQERLNLWNKHAARFNSDLDTVGQNVAHIGKILQQVAHERNEVRKKLARQRMEEDYKALVFFLRTKGQRYEAIKELLSLPNREDLKEAVYDVIGEGNLPSDQRAILSILWDRFEGQFQPLSILLHTIRQNVRRQLDQSSSTIDATVKLETRWKDHKTETVTDLLAVRTWFENEIIKKYQQDMHQTLREQLLGECVPAAGDAAALYHAWMEEIHEEYISHQSPIFAQQRKAMGPFWNYTTVWSGSMEMSKQLFIILKQTVHRTLSAAKRAKIQQAIHELYRSRQWNKEQRIEFDTIVEEFQYLNWWDLKLQGFSNQSLDPDSGLRSYIDTHISLDQGLMTSEQKKQEQVEEVTYRALRKRLKTMRESGEAKAWIINPQIWEILEWDVSVRNHDELQNDTTPRLNYVVLHEKILSSRALKRTFSSKQSLIRLSSKLADIATELTQDCRAKIPRDRDLNLLQLVFEFLQAGNRFLALIAEQAQLSWISTSARQSLENVLKYALRMRRTFLKAWGTLMDINLSTQGVDVLSHYHTKATRDILLWKQHRKPQLPLPTRSNREEDNLPTFGDEDNLSIGLPEIDLPAITVGTLRYRRDRQAETNYWDYTQYRGPNYERVRVHYCSSRESTERVLQRYFAHEKVLGFDMEWKASASSSDSIKDNVSLIQVASESRIGLFQIARYEKDATQADLVSPTLKKLMESSSIIKTGVNIKADCTRLRKHLGIDSNGLMELSYLHKLVKFAKDDPSMINKRPVKLSGQVEEHLGLPLWKGDVRSSDWTKKLEEGQILCE